MSQERLFFLLMFNVIVYDLETNFSVIIISDIGRTRMSNRNNISLETPLNNDN